MLTPSRSIVGILDFPKQMVRNSGRAVIACPYPSAIHSGIGNAEMEDAPAARAGDRQAHGKALPQRTSSFFKIYSLRTIPNCIATGKVRYHSARRLASTRWVPAITQ